MKTIKKCLCGAQLNKYQKACNNCRINNLRYDKNKGTFEEQLLKLIANIKL